GSFRERYLPYLHDDGWTKRPGAVDLLCVARWPARLVTGRKMDGLLPGRESERRPCSSGNLHSPGPRRQRAQNRGAVAWGFLVARWQYARACAPAARTGIVLA